MSQTKPQSKPQFPKLVKQVEKVMTINDALLGLQQNIKSDTKSDTRSNIDTDKLNEILAQLMDCLSKLKDELATSPDTPLVPPNAPLVSPHALPNTNDDTNDDTDAEPESELDFVEQIIDATSYELADLIFDKYFGHSVGSSANVGGKKGKKYKYDSGAGFM
jgi:hypothetical protein